VAKEKQPKPIQTQENFGAPFICRWVGDPISLTTGSTQVSQILGWSGPKLICNVICKINLTYLGPNHSRLSWLTSFDSL